MIILDVWESRVAKGDRMNHQAEKTLSYPLLVVMGCARLPKAVLGDVTGTLMIELSLDSQAGRIVGVGATVPLPGYRRLLRRLLIDRHLNEVECVAQGLQEHLRGPLLKPTIAALLNAVANSKSVEWDGERAAAS